MCLCMTTKARWSVPKFFRLNEMFCQIPTQRAGNSTAPLSNAFFCSGFNPHRRSNSSATMSSTKLSRGSMSGCWSVIWMQPARCLNRAFSKLTGAASGWRFLLSLPLSRSSKTSLANSTAHL